MLIREVLHTEFISAMKTVQNPTIFMNKQKKKMNNFGNLLIFEIFTETLEHNIRKSQKICFFR